jgi:hypothetical protein
MVTVALYVRLDAKPGKEKEVESFLKGGLAIVQEEPATTAWFAIRMGPSTYGIFDAFPDDARPAGPPVGPRCGGTHGQGRRPAGEAAVDREGGRPRRETARLSVSGAAAPAQEANASARNCSSSRLWTAAFPVAGDGDAARPT